MSSAPTDFGSNGPGSRDPEAIARAIDETRSEVDETLDALQARLSPGQILDRAMELVRANGGQFAGNLGRTVRDNPWPVILTGVGLAWMMAATRSAAPAARPSGRGGVGERVGAAAERMTGAASDAISESRNRVAAAAEYASTAASHTAERVSDGLANATSLVRDQGQRMSEGLSGLLRDQPLVVGAVGIAVGALLGYLLPATEAENRLLEEATRAGAPADDSSIRPAVAGNQDPLGDHEAQALSGST